MPDSEPKKLRFINRLSCSDYEFYIGNAVSFAEEAIRLANLGNEARYNEFSAGYYAETAAKYYNDYQTLEGKTKNKITV